MNDLVTNPSYAVNDSMAVYSSSRLMDSSYPKEGQLIGGIDFDHLDAADPRYSLVATQEYFRHEDTEPGVAANSPFITSSCPG